MFQKTKRRPVHARAGAAGMTPDDPPFVRGDVQHGLCRNAAHTWAEARPRHLRGMSGWPHNRPNARIVRVSIFAGNRRTETGQNCNNSGSGVTRERPGSCRIVPTGARGAGCCWVCSSGASWADGKRKGRRPASLPAPCPVTPIEAQNTDGELCALVADAGLSGCHVLMCWPAASVLRLGAAAMLMVYHPRLMRRGSGSSGPH